MTVFSQMSAAIKRSREEDEAELEAMRFDRKKPRSLPFRTSPTTKHTSFFSQSRRTSRPPVLTPAESSEDESDTGPPIRHPSSLMRMTASTIAPVEDAASDLDMIDTEPLGSPLWSPNPCTSPTSLLTQTPVSSKALAQVRQLSISSTRIPTPIYGHFVFSPLETTSSIPINASDSEPSEAAGNQESQQDIFLRRRRLPSPISEDEDMESPTTMTGSLMRNLDMGVTTSPYPIPDCQMMTPISPETNEHDKSEWRDKRRGALDSRMEGVGYEHSVSEGKMVLSMGFRADCDKCRSRVPGHYSHLYRV